MNVYRPDNTLCYPSIRAARVVRQIMISEGVDDAWDWTWAVGRLTRVLEAHSDAVVYVGVSTVPGRSRDPCCWRDEAVEICVISDMVCRSGRCVWATWAATRILPGAGVICA
jgi:hypothetical protein